MRKKLSTSVNTSVKVSQRVTFVKYAVAGTLIFALMGGAVFLYLNFGNSENAEAGSRKTDNFAQASKAYLSQILDLSHLDREEMGMLTNRDFVNDTIQKEYSSVKWNLNNSVSHLTLEITNTQYEFSLEVFDMNGSRVLYFENITSEKVFVDKLELRPNHQYNYLVRNSVGEMYAGDLSFN